MDIKKMKQAIRYYDKAYSTMNEHQEFLALSSFLENLMYDDKKKPSREIDSYESLNLRIMLKIYHKLSCNLIYRKMFRSIMK